MRRVHKGAHRRFVAEVRGAEDLGIDVVAVLERVGERLEDDDSTTFAGSWSNYPWFDDGKVIFTGVEEGLFVVDSRAKSSATNNGNRSTR